VQVMTRNRVLREGALTVTGTSRSTSSASFGSQPQSTDS
jgi:hypothetical protein